MAYWLADAEQRKFYRINQNRARAEREAASSASTVQLVPYRRKAPGIRELIRRDPFNKFLALWDKISPAHLARFKRCLASARSEAPLQRLFAREPLLLVQHLGGGHGRWVIPQKRLGSEFVPDFVVGEKSSIGCEWQLVELESPTAPLFTRSGDPSRHLTHALRQIDDWRSWLGRNRDYATRPLDQGGLGLTDISSAAEGFILIGRRKDLSPKDNERRRQMTARTGVTIHTYDFIADAIRGRI